MRRSKIQHAVGRLAASRDRVLQMRRGTGQTHDTLGTRRSMPQILLSAIPRDIVPIRGIFGRTPDRKRQGYPMGTEVGMVKTLGIGGIFFRSKDPAGLT